MKKKYVSTIGLVVLFFLAGFLLWKMCTSSNQSTPAFGIKTEFVGEYSQNNSDWKPIKKIQNFLRMRVI